MNSTIRRSFGLAHYLKRSCVARRHDVISSLARQRQTSLAVRSLSQRKPPFEGVDDAGEMDLEEILDFSTANAKAGMSTAESHYSSSRGKREVTSKAESSERDRSPLAKDPWDLEDMLNSKVNFEDLPEFSPDLVSRISLERVKIYPDKIPTLSTLASLQLPPPPMPHPGLGQGKQYALSRKREQYNYILQQVSSLAATRVDSILKLQSMEDKQDAVDALFEEIEFDLKDKEPILGKHPSFGNWVERALEEYLKSIQKNAKSANENTNPALSSDQSSDVVDDSQASPMFMECFGPDDSEDKPVPSILSPLSAKSSESGGRMVEEWELAAHKSTRRIMLRQSTRAIARILLQSEGNMAPRIFVHGRQGVGKTAALASIVACARKSGHIVLYIPDGDDLHKNGYYVEPNERRKGIFDLPVVSQHICQQFLGSHQGQLQGFVVNAETLDEFFTEDQLKQLGSSAGGDYSVANLLQVGVKKTSLAPMCLSAAIDVLMKQDKLPFLMVLDEFNCFFEPGHYFHGDYDAAVKKFIPYDQISLFKPALDAMAISAVSPLNADEVFVPKPPVCMMRGGILVATSESRAIARKITEALVENVKWQQQQTVDSSSNTSLESNTAKAVIKTAPIHFVEVPRLSPLEVEHVLANYEATGIGKLRLDRGETVMNDQEVAYLRMVSGGVAQKLMNACIM